MACECQKNVLFLRTVILLRSLINEYSASFKNLIKLQALKFIYIFFQFICVYHKVKSRRWRKGKGEGDLLFTRNVLRFNKGKVLNF